MSVEKTGLFIVLDGQDGSGKTTQVATLKDTLERIGYEVVTTREPGGSPGAEAVRSLLVNGDPGRWDGISELLLFAAARRNHVETVIKPALAAGKIVLCDRFVLSTMAYQGYGHGVSLGLIETITRIAIGDFEPDLTLLFYIDPAIGLQRAAQRRGGEERFESLGMAFHERVRSGFRAVIDNPDKYPRQRYLPINILNTPETREASIASLTSNLIEIIWPYIRRATLTAAADLREPSYATTGVTPIH
jgi:dTMP kinase